MANYRKSFNFRNGVQVDDDNLVVNGVGNVGIGTTIPTELLDVRGTAKVVGLVTANNAFVSGVSTFSDVRIGTAITISASAGIITATSFFGDGATLSNLPTSQWVDVDVGLGFTSIYAQGNVGVGTTDPRSSFQVGGNPLTGDEGVGISSSTGNITSSGIVSATSFVGFGSGITILNASNVSLGTLSNDRLPTIDNAKLPSNISVSGVVTATSGFSGNLTGDVTGDVTGNLVGIASTARSLTGTPDINVGVITATKLIANLIEVPSTGVTTVSQLLHVGTGGTGFAALANGRSGIGTANPGSDLQIRKTSGTLLEVLSDSGQARVSVGQSVGVGNSTGIIRFGNSAKTLDVINRDTGSLNMILHGGGSGIDTGRFNWIYGQSNDELMSLTYEGRLGIGITNPSNDLHVVGTSTVTGDSFFGGDSTVTGTLTVGSGANLTVLGGAGGVLANVNLNSNSGVTTVSELHVAGVSSVGIGTNLPIVGLDARGQTAIFNRINIQTGTELNSNGLFVDSSSCITGNIGLGTTALTTIANGFEGNVQVHGQVNIYDNSLIFHNLGGIGIGTTAVIGAVDMRFAKLTASLRSPFYPPQLTTAERNAITPANVAEGAVIYNTSNNRLEVRLPGGWAGISTIA